MFTKTRQRRRPLLLMSLLALCAPALVSTSAFADFPENDQDLEDDMLSFSAVGEADFDAALEELRLLFQPLFFFHGGQLVFDARWDSPVVNAYASRNGNQWIIAMHGGLARRPEITRDGFSLVVCHEIGHQLGGYPFYGANDWAASEGESDWYATQACARWLWWSDAAENATFRTITPALVRNKCDADWTAQAERDLCYRIAMAGKSLADWLGGGTNSTDFAKRDAHEVTTTLVTHPAAQCRLDTYVAGALCTVMPDFDLIPGLKSPFGRNSSHAELMAAVNSCMPTSPLVGAVDYNGRNRPRCWFKNKLSGPIH